MSNRPLSELVYRELISKVDLVNRIRELEAALARVTNLLNCPPSIEVLSNGRPEPFPYIDVDDLIEALQEPEQ